MEQIILFGNLSSDTVCHQLGYLQLHRMIFLLCEVAGIPGESMGNKKILASSEDQLERHESDK